MNPDFPDQESPSPDEADSWDISLTSNPSHIDRSLIERIFAEASGNMLLATPSPTELVTWSRFESEGFIDRGAVGEVYGYRDTDLGHEVAVKVMRPVPSRNQELREQFENEGRITSKLQHPNVLPIYAIGKLEDGRPFYIMRRVRGKTLYDRIRKTHDENQRGRRFQDPDFQVLIESFLTVCDVLAHAHSLKICHLDIKSLNVLIEPNGQTFVADWGFARPPQEAPSNVNECVPEETSTVRRRIGSPAWWSPEQADPERGPADELTDIYLLGSLLYEILTGRPPHLRAPADATDPKPKDEKELPPRVLTNPTPNPSSESINLPRELVSICRAAMSGDRVIRQGYYPSVALLRQDVVCWRIGSRVSSHEYGAIEIVSRQIRKYPLVAATLLVSSIILGIAGMGVINARAARTIAETKAISELKNAETRFDSALRAWRGGLDIVRGKAQTSLAKQRQSQIDRIAKEIQTLIDDSSNRPVAQLSLIEARMELAHIRRDDLNDVKSARDGYESIVRDLRSPALSRNPSPRYFELLLDGLMGKARMDAKLTGAEKTSGTAEEILHAASMYNQLFPDYLTARMAPASAMRFDYLPKMDTNIDNPETLLGSIDAAVKMLNEAEILAHQGKLKLTTEIVVSLRTANSTLTNEEINDWILRRIRNERGVFLSDRVILLTDLKRLPEALSLQQEIIETTRRQIAIEPLHKKYNIDYMTDMRLLASIFRMMNDYPAAIETLDHARKHGLEFVRQFPDDASVSKTLLDIEHSLAVTLRKTGKISEAHDILARQLATPPPNPISAPVSELIDRAVTELTQSHILATLKNKRLSFIHLNNAFELRTSAYAIDQLDENNLREALLYAYSLLEAVGSEEQTRKELLTGITVFVDKIELRRVNAKAEFGEKLGRPFAELEEQLGIMALSIAEASVPREKGEEYAKIAEVSFDRATRFFSSSQSISEPLRTTKLAGLDEYTKRSQAFIQAIPK